MTSRITINPFDNPFDTPLSLEELNDSSYEALASKIFQQSEESIAELAVRVANPSDSEVDELAVRISDFTTVPSSRAEGTYAIMPRSTEVRPSRVLSSIEREALKRKFNFKTEGPGGSSCVQNYDSKTDKINTAKELYADLHERLLKTGQSKLKFYFSIGYYTYFDEETNQTEWVDFLGLDDRVLNKFLDLVESIEPYRNNTNGIFAAGKKGNTAGPKALQRNSKAFEKVPMNLDGAVKLVFQPKWSTFEEDKRGVMERSIFFLHHLSNTLSPKLVEFYNNQVRAFREHKGENRGRDNALLADLELIRKVIGGKDDLGNVYHSEFKNPDFFAVAVALEKSHADSLDRAHDAVQAEMKRIFKNSDDPAVKEYTHDVFALLLPHRCEYWRYCENNNLVMKRDSIEDFYLQEAIRYANNQINPSKSVETIFGSLSPQTREELTKLYTDVLGEINSKPALDWHVPKAIEAPKEETGLLSKVKGAFARLTN